MDDLIEYLFDVMKEKHINYRIGNDWHKDWPSAANPDINLVIYNPNWEPIYERPVQLAHEIGHVLAHHPCKNQCETVNVDDRYEEEAHEIALRLILDYIADNDIKFETKQQLIDYFGIPDNMLYPLDRLLSTQHYDIFEYHYPYRPSFGRIILSP